MYFAGEGKAHIKSRVRAAAQALQEEERNELAHRYGGILPIIPIMVNSPLRNTGHLKEIENIILEARRKWPYFSETPALMIFDTLAASHYFKDENSNGEMQRIVDALNSYAERFQCCVIVIAHPPKSNDAKKG